MQITTGQLREALFNVITGIKSGEMDQKHAETIIKSATQINKNMAHEIAKREQDLKIGTAPNRLDSYSKTPITA